MSCKKIFISLVSLFCFFSFSIPCGAENYDIKDYTVTWRVAKVGFVKMAIEKENNRLFVILSSLGGRIATVYLGASEAKKIGDLLLKTGDYYEMLKKSDDSEPYKEIKGGTFRVVFSSSPGGKDFNVKVTKSSIIGPTALLTKEEALKIAEYLRNADKMTVFFNDRINLMLKGSPN